MNVITVTDVTKLYDTRMKKGGVTALDGVSIEILPAEIFGLLGPNGAGKTTLFKILLGITEMTSGEAFLFGLPPSDPNSRLKVGYLPENHRFPEHLTGIGLLEFAAYLSNVPKSEIDGRVDKMLEMVDMSKWGSMKIKKYSKGMLQRIGLAQAMINDPDCIFLDEPTDGVDPVGKMEIKEVMLRIRDEGKTIFLNSHLLSEVESVADRVAILRQGKVARIGSVADLTSKALQYEIEANFGESLFDIPENIGKKKRISTNKLVVELVDAKKINWIIDMMRRKDIDIISVKPIKITLEQSFMEAVREEKEWA